MADSTPKTETSGPQLPKWLATSLLGLLALLGTALLEAYGDSVFDNLTVSLGKRRWLQLVFLLFCTIGYFSYLLSSRPRQPKVARRRGVCFAKGDSEPLCPYCYDRDASRIHLARVDTIEAHDERWECHSCDHDYSAHHGAPLEMRLSVRRRRLQR